MLASDPGGATAFLYYFVLPLAGFWISAFCAYLLARPAIKESRKKRADERERQERLDVLMFGQEVDRTKGIWARQPGVDERLTDIQKIADDTRAKVESHMSNKAIHVHNGSLP